MSQSFRAFSATNTHTFFHCWLLHLCSSKRNRSELIKNTGVRLNSFSAFLRNTVPLIFQRGTMVFIYIVTKGVSMLDASFQNALLMPHCVILGLWLQRSRNNASWIKACTENGYLKVIWICFSLILHGWLDLLNVKKYTHTNKAPSNPEGQSVDPPYITTTCLQGLNVHVVAMR